MKDDIKPKKKNKVLKVILLIVMLCALATLIYSGYKIVNWYIDNKKNEEIAIKMKDIADIIEIPDTEQTEIVNPPENKFDPYWDYVNMDLMSVDFNELLNTNKNTVGWVKVEGTTINYPVVQGTNNEYYLNHSFDNSYNGSGWIFMDYRNDSKNLNSNTIIFGHSMRNKTMFHSLRNTLTNEWLNDNSKHIVKYSTPYENMLWQVFSVYTIEQESYYITPEFNNDEEYASWLEDMQKRSKKNFNTKVDTNDKVLTLSSCYNTNGIRMVLHAKLIKKEAR